MLTIPLSRPITLTGADKGYYRITGADLDLIAKEYVDQLNKLDAFTINAPLPSLESNTITVTPLSGGTVLDAQPMPVTNSLKVVPKPVPGLPAPGTPPPPAAAPFDELPALPPALPPEPAEAPAPGPAARQGAGERSGRSPVFPSAGDRRVR